MFRAILDQAAALPGGDPSSNASPAARDPAGTAATGRHPLHLLGAPRGGGVRTAADEEAGARVPASPLRRRRAAARAADGGPPLAPAAAPPPPTGGGAPRVEDEDRERVPLGQRALRAAEPGPASSRAPRGAPSRGVERGAGKYQSRLLGDRRDAAKFDRPPDERAAPPPAARADGAPEPGWDRPLNPRQVARIRKRRRDLDVLRSVGRLPAWLDPREGRRVAKPKTESRQRHASSRPRTEKGAFMTRAQLDAEGYARDPATGDWSKRGPAVRELSARAWANVTAAMAPLLHPALRMKWLYNDLDVKFLGLKEHQRRH
ncbi:chloride channel [Aureococcus anophagefferens]|nr:chloride channel [Aureococcus anophagefferens]